MGLDVAACLIPIVPTLCWIYKYMCFYLYYNAVTWNRLLQSKSSLLARLVQFKNKDYSRK